LDTLANAQNLLFGRKILLHQQHNLGACAENVFFSFPIQRSLVPASAQYRQIK
jgi:hypothetical protein